MRYIRLFEDKKESKFKVGDYVRFKTDCLGGEYNLDEDEQKEISKVSLIQYDNNEYGGSLITLDRLESDGGNWYVDEDEIEKLSELEADAYKYNL